MRKPPAGMISIMFGMPSPSAHEKERDEDNLGIESPGKDNGDDDEIAILSILRAMKDQGRAGVRAVRIFASSLKRMADAFEARDDELEEAAAAAHAALGDLHIGEDD
jgi:hypothetical protein